MKALLLSTFAALSVCLALMGIEEARGYTYKLVFISHGEEWVIDYNQSYTDCILQTRRSQFLHCQRDL